MINPDHISKSLETNFWVMDPGDPGCTKFGCGIRDGKKSDPGSGINIPDPQHCPHYILKYVLVRGMRQA
jgi:hypothetical protein